MEKAPCCGRKAAVDGSASKLLRKKRVRRSAPSLLGLGVSLGCLAWGSNSGVARASWIDPDTLPEYRTKEFEGDGRHFDLVFSDEFERCVVCESWCFLSEYVVMWLC